MSFFKEFQVPISIFLGAIVIAGAILVKDFSTTGNTNAIGQVDPNMREINIDPTRVKRSENRNVYGDPNAELTIVEFSDFECPFCVKVAPIIKQIVDDSNGRIAWEYRHLPLEAIHPKALPAAIASECVAKLGGNEAFWQLGEKLFDTTHRWTVDSLTDEAIALGIEKEEYLACLDDDAIFEIVRNDALTADEFGGTGTPYSLIIGPNNQVEVVNGAQPATVWVNTIKRFDS